jgi:hypothetical protein
MLFDGKKVGAATFEKSETGRFGVYLNDIDDTKASGQSTPFCLTATRYWRKPQQATNLGVWS